MGKKNSSVQYFQNDTRELERLYFDYINIYGPSGTGKTSFLYALMSHFENHPIVCLDFSTFSLKSMEDALCFIKKKMSDLYLSLLYQCEDEWNSLYACSRYMAVLEGTCDEEQLSHSLLHMVYALRNSRRGDRDMQRPMIFIDEVSRPLLYAKAYGFFDRLKRFYDVFLDIDHYELTGGIYTTSYAPLNADVHFGLKYISDRPVNKIAPLVELCKNKGIPLSETCRETMAWGHVRFFDKTLSLSECFHELVKENGERVSNDDDLNIALSTELKGVISEKRAWVEEENRRLEAAEREKERRTAEEYAAPLAETVMIPSKFAGIRELQIDVKNKNKYEACNDLLIAMYDRFGNTISHSDVYDFIQGVNRNAPKRRDVKGQLLQLKEFAESRKDIYSCYESTDGWWGRFDLERSETEHGYGDLALVKIYLSLREQVQTAELFNEVIRYLITYGQHRFHAKIALRNRYDQMCFWVAREDFFDLEHCLNKYRDVLITPLPFVAYRDNVGISREFVSWDSHNGVQAQLICAYLQNISSPERIDLLDMYGMYVSAWNGELCADHPFTREFKNGNAQELLVLLETLDVLLGNDVIDDDHIFLSGDGSLWSDLGSAKNWFEVGENIVYRLTKDN